jgi:predicted ATP-dependent serine protease
LLPGHHMTIFARPEIGKSAIALNIAVMAASRGFNVLYLGNEDPARDLMFRAIQLFTGMSWSAVQEQLPDALTLAQKRGLHKLLFRELAPGSVTEIDRLVRKHRPALFIVDQIRNITAGTKGADNLTQRLDMAAQGIRNIAKRNASRAISITQAGDSARNKIVLDDGDVDSSNTGIPGACDVLIGVGCNEVMRDAGQRMLTLAKNKVGAVHGHFEVTMDPITLKIKSLEG